MENRAGKYIEEAVAALDDGDACFAIWLAENAAELSAGDDPDLLSFRAKLDAGRIADAAEEANSDLRRTMRLLPRADRLIYEEWVLVITDLSTAHAIERFAARAGVPAAIPLAAPAMALLGEKTGGFTRAEFRLALDEVRQRNPNPLPPPLDYRPTLAG